jgi:hypothetical protein
MSLFTKDRIRIVAAEELTCVVYHFAFLHMIEAFVGSWQVCIFLRGIVMRSLFVEKMCAYGSASIVIQYLLLANEYSCYVRWVLDHSYLQRRQRHTML